MQNLLEVKHLNANYGAVKALKEVSFHVKAGEIVSMIGPNGAGKSTALKAVLGLMDDIEGSIIFLGENIINLSTDERVKKGMASVPEGRRVFPNMTVLENLEMGAFIRKDKNEIANDIEKIFAVFPILKARIKQKAGTLSTGEQQMLAIARALMSRPKLLLADEPSLGLSPVLVSLIVDKLKEINSMGTTILLVEQNVRMALSISDRVYLFKMGKIELEGTGKELMDREDIKKYFLEM